MASQPTSSQTTTLISTIELCKQFRIRHHNSMPYHPKMNKTVEAANKNLKKIIQKMVIGMKCSDTHCTDITPSYEPPRGQPLIR
ncbi:hypothetical protein CR513_55494, partial [Mucuna pruriens]